MPFPWDKKSNGFNSKDPKAVMERHRQAVERARLIQEGKVKDVMEFGSTSISTAPTGA